MSDGAISKIEYGDSDQRMREKINQNFLVLCRRGRVSGSDQQIIINSITPNLNAMVQDAIEEALNQAEARFFEQAYPIGSIIWTNSKTDDRMKRGTWRQHKDVFLLATGDKYANNAQGGAETTKLTVANLPSHSHPFPELASDEASAKKRTMASLPANASKKTSQDNDAFPEMKAEPFSIMPPYLARYCFERVA